MHTNVILTKDAHTHNLTITLQNQKPGLGASYAIRPGNGVGGGAILQPRTHTGEHLTNDGRDIRNNTDTAYQWTECRKQWLTAAAAAGSHPPLNTQAHQHHHVMTGHGYACPDWRRTRPLTYRPMTPTGLGCQQHADSIPAMCTVWINEYYYNSVQMKYDTISLK